MKNKDTVQFSVVFSDDVYEKLQKLSAKQKTSMATIIRKFVDKGLQIESYLEKKEELRRIVHDELTEVFRKEIERLIKLQVKGTKASAITMYAALQIISESYADEGSFIRMVASANKQAAAYMKQKEKSDAENMQDAKQIVLDMKKVVNVGEG